jgi:phage terminase large subunit-like protein
MSSSILFEPSDTLQRTLNRMGPAAKMRARWLLQAREAQLTPEGDWLIWLLKSGRGAGKTRAGAEDSAHFARTHPGSRIAIVAPTFSVARDVCVEGESGLLQVLHPDEIAAWNRSQGALWLRNGSRWQLFSAEKPDRLRGPQHHRAWCEELGSWAYPQATWDMLMFGLRLGHRPQAVITSTPKPLPLLKDIAARPTTVVTTESTFANSENLSAATLEELSRRYEGTTLGRQELYGEIIEDVEGALWTRAMIETTRTPYDQTPQTMDVIVVGVDVAATSTRSSDETGIVVAGRSADHAYVLDDLSTRATPEMWGATVVHAYQEWEADAIVYETNQGGEMIAAVIRAAAAAIGVPAARLHLVPVHASRGKRTRAEPVAVMYTEQGGARVHHTRAFPELEDQMCTWVPGDDSPDRMDALVWALTYLMDGPPSKRRKLRFRD